MDRKISICIPTYKRVEMTIESISKVINDPRISEIVIVDDASPDNSFERLVQHFHTNLKVKIFRNEVNLDCYRNKRQSIEYSTNEWCILLDSDNIIDLDYINTLFNISEWNSDTIYTPSFAKPTFDFRAFSGTILDKNNIGENLRLYNNLEVCLNAANYFVNREKYLTNFDTNIDPVTSDSIFTCYNWLRYNNKIYVVHDLEYYHRIGHPSHYTTNINKTPLGLHQNILSKLQQFSNE